ncbi:MAG TPA: deoxynucleoside kinase [Burkholderiaceae bacterium]|jgi:deoxyadenosine/deoxycytidine kinase|nr:deoxynucleoside kinase [Burkholderiaceae bacterium]HPE01746.1 deoxynucleoside kinase [Burkholderiaceae bacterium]HRZ01467.1 deoxynucleoside kinase [Burkholderiaceae bacterium]
MKPLPAHVVIEGPIGVGKTTLARRLAQRLGAELLLEAPHDNPFLARYYREGARHALATQLAFLVQRAAQHRVLAGRRAARPLVADFLFEKDALFARLTLAPDELALYEALAARMALDAVVPDLVIYLRAEPATLAARVARRADPAESGLSRAYLERLSAAYAEFFHRYEAAPVLEVNTEHLDLADAPADLDLLLTRVAGMRGRREHFNLAA